MMILRMALAQVNVSVGDIGGNLEKLRNYCTKAAQQSADLVVFPELCLCGYPPEDLLHKKHFLRDTRKALEELSSECRNIAAIVGFAEYEEGKCYNSLAFISEGAIKKVYRKGLLPNYEVFDEKRYFQPGGETMSVEIKGIRILLTICEDIWDIDWLDSFTKNQPKDLIINISASPFYFGKFSCRVDLLKNCASHFNCPVAYCNLIGGQDELVFDGRSMVIDENEHILCQAKEFREDVLIVDFERSDKDQSVHAIACGDIHQPVHLDEEAEIYQALVLGTRDYIHKNGFKKVLIGMSGGIDSSLTAVIAVDALGPKNVIGITMPSRFNSSETISDAEKSCRNLGAEFHTVPIGEILDQFNGRLAIVDGWADDGIAFENLQARIRGTILMTYSNRFGHMVLTTGNKSETAVGYSTLYGDTAGGFAVIKDVYKTMVYRLARYVNKLHEKEVVPVSVIDRPPSAELRPDQKDSDSLPDYDLLDGILKGYIEDDMSAAELIGNGFDSEQVKKVIRLVDRNEYKRRQNPPGVKITPKAFGKDRRMPITNRYQSS